MDLEIIGRHALLFDDDSMATFVNSSEALVDWYDLLIDRYDVRHLLASPPPRPKRRRTNSEDPDLELELEHERYLDLPAESPSPSPSQDQNDLNDVTHVGGFNAVPFSYGSSSESNDQKNADMDSGFLPPFPVPESLLLNLPPTEKLHQIIARTATFVSKHGGQSEIVLRVKQGNNPTFGFLMPDHHLHPYFRYLVDHQELLTGKSFEEDKKNESGQGALSLLGSVYGTGEDEDTKDESAMDSTINESDECDNDIKQAVSSGSEGLDGATKSAAEGYTVFKHPLLAKEKATVVKRNPSVSTVNGGDTNKTEKKDGSPEQLSTSADKSSATQTQPKFELPVVEPPADMKRVIDKIVEFILRNGKEFEAILAAQDVKYGRFPFLLPASLYHAYYRKVLREAEEPKVCGEGKISVKRDKKQERTTIAKEEDKPTVGSDIPDDSAKKEKFKMVIGKPKKDVQEEPPKPVQPQRGVTIDADAAAAILQAARRGIRNPNLGILPSNSLNETSSQGLGSDSSQLSSQPSSMTKNVGEISEQLVSCPAAKSIAKTAALAAASEADSSEAGLSKEQKLKAERLKRAKMFMAMLKSGAEDLKAERARSLSIEPLDSGFSGSGANAVESAVREREGSSVPLESEKIHLDDNNNERRAKRNYRLRSQKNEGDEKDGEEEENGRVEDTEETGNEKKSSRKRHSDHSRDRKKHKRRHSSKDTRSRDKHKHDSSSDDEDQKRSRHRHNHSKSSHKHESDDLSDNGHRRRHSSSKHKPADLSDDEHHHRHRSSKHKHADSSEDEHRHRHRSSKYKREKSSDDERGHRHKSSKRRKEKATIDEEGNQEIVSKPDKSKAPDDRKAGGEASIDTGKSNHEGNGPSSGPNGTTQVSEELRAKIRAMLTGTL